MISIAVPSYNYGEFLESCLSSIFMQDYSNYEVLIADGGSTDNSIEIIERFCKLDDRFRFVSNEDSGQSNGINKAFAKSRGDILCFLNSDDCFISRNALSSAVAAFSNYPFADLISFTGYYINQHGKLIKPVKLRYHPLDNISLMKYRAAVLQPATFWRKAVSESIRFDENAHYTFDTVFFWQAYTRYSWLELTDPVAGHRLHGLNKSLQINAIRIGELVDYERMKFGAKSPRVLYLSCIRNVISLLDYFPFFKNSLKKLVYRVVNSLAFISVYRLPGI